MTDSFLIGGADGPETIFLAGTIGDSYMLPAFLILIVFYGIYIGKMIKQRKKGIQTDQIGRRKEKGKRRHIEIIMKYAAYGVLLTEILSILYGYSAFGIYGRKIGIILGITGNLFFAAAVWAMRDSWRAGIAEHDQTALISGGIYKYSRNPAFLGFDLVYAGILFLYFNWVLFFITLWAVIMLHLQILQEELYLAETFGDCYLDYKKHTARYLGRC